MAWAGETACPWSFALLGVDSEIADVAQAPCLPRLHSCSRAGRSPLSPGVARLSRELRSRGAG